MNAYAAVCDDFSATVRIHTKLDLAPSRETTLHFFESLQRHTPSMRRLRRREDSALILEELDEGAGRRWVRLDSGAVRLGMTGSCELEAWREWAARVLEIAAANLTLSDLDVDNGEAVFGFDLEAQGNHDEIIRDALLGGSPLAQLWEQDGLRPIDCQPFFGASLTSECDLQAYVDVKSRTSTFEVRTGDYRRSRLTVYLIIRKYMGFANDPKLAALPKLLLDVAEEWAGAKVIPLFIQPIRESIASRH